MIELAGGGPIEDRFPGIGDLDAVELLVIVVTAVATNACVYGAILIYHGVRTPDTLLLTVAGAAVSLVAAVWLVVVYQVRELVGG